MQNGQQHTAAVAVIDSGDLRDTVYCEELGDFLKTNGDKIIILLMEVFVQYNTYLSIYITINL